MSKCLAAFDFFYSDVFFRNWLFGSVAAIRLLSGKQVYILNSHKDLKLVPEAKKAKLQIILCHLEPGIRSLINESGALNFLEHQAFENFSELRLVAQDKAQGHGVFDKARLRAQAAYVNAADHSLWKIEFDLQDVTSSEYFRIER